VDAVNIDAAIAMRAKCAQDSFAVGAPLAVRWRTSTYRICKDFPPRVKSEMVVVDRLKVAWPFFR
jgi:hypothetical protein